jgi:murein DD-endopeptidase MepM/ murein hydrolase activator NlpD
VRHRLRRTWSFVALLAVTLMFLPVDAAGAADPVAQAEARVTAARRAANDAAARYEAAQTSYYTLHDDIAAARRQIAGLEREAKKLRTVATARAIEAYKGGNSNLDAIMSGSDVLEAMRRTALLDRVNRGGNDAVDQLGAKTEDLHVSEQQLADKLDQQADVVAKMKQREREVQSKLAAAVRAERSLKQRLERERRARELAVRLQKARAAARPARAASGGGGDGAVLARGPSVTVGGGFQCPVPGSSFGDSFGAPRSGGRSHQGVDMMAPRGAAIYAVVSGSVSHSSSNLGGNQIWLHGSDGNTYFYAHLDSYVGPPRSVALGELIGRVGDTGNARGGPTHLHFEIHPGGGGAVDPYPTLRAHC